MNKLWLWLMVLCVLFVGSASAVIVTGTGVALGFNDSITVTLTLVDGVIKDVTIAHQDTAGIADSAISELSKAIVNNNSINVDVTSGATLTSRGILEAAKNALIAAGLDPNDYMEKVELEPEQPTLPDKESNIPAGAHTGTAKGFEGDITVGLTLQNGRITAVYVDHQDTAGIADSAISELSKAIVNNNSINVDVTSGATLTSRGILEAAKNALIAAGLDPNDYMEKVELEPEQPTLPDKESNIPAGAHTGTAKGFEGDITVGLTLQNGRITAVYVDHQDTAGIADSAISELSKAIVNNNSINVDVTSGATLTSRGILEAAKNALIAAGLDPNDYMEKVELEPEQPTLPDKESNIPAGAHTGTAKGFDGDITVGLTLQNGRITAVYVDHQDTAGIADSAISELSKAIVNNNSINVDVASGATLTSRGILEAAKNALIAAGLDPNDYMGEDHVTVLPGDPDGDGVVSIGDAIAVLQYCTGGNASLELRTADVTGDGKVDLHDALCILQYAAGWSVTLN